MKTIFILMLASILVSCGNNNGGSSSSDLPDKQEERENPRHPNEERQEEEAENEINEESMYLDTTTNSEMELLNVTVSDQISHAGDRISFVRPLIRQTIGKKITCQLNIPQNEIWTYAISSEGMTITYGDGSSKKFSSIGKNQNDLYGSWLWKGVENNLHVIKRITFLPNRAVISQDCEG